MLKGEFNDGDDDLLDLRQDLGGTVDGGDDLAWRQSQRSRIQKGARWLTVPMVLATPMAAYVLSSSPVVSSVSRLASGSVASAAKLSLMRCRYESH